MFLNTNKQNRVKNFQEKNKNNTQEEKDFSRGRRKIIIKKYVKKLFYLLLFFLFGSIIFFIFFSNFFVISKISFERKNLEFNPETISKDLESFIGKNIFFIDKKNIEKILKEKNPYYKKISVKKIYPETLFFEVFDYNNVFEINTFFTKKNKENGAFQKYLQKFLISQYGELKAFPVEKKDEDGKITTRNELKQIFIKENTLKEIDVLNNKQEAQNFTNSKILSKIQKINSYIEVKENINVKNIFYWPRGKEIHFNTEKGNFHFTFSKDIDKQIEKIFYFKESKNISNFSKKEFEYLDLRIAKKIIYKY